MGATLEIDRTEPLEAGIRVEVRQRFDQRWTRGFAIAETRGDRFLIRRLSDGTVLPTEFTSEELRPERKRRQGMWWA